MLYPKDLCYLAVTDGFAPSFKGIWEGKGIGIYAFTTTNDRTFEGIDGVAPYFRVDGVDQHGKAILIDLPTDSDEYSMMRRLFMERKILTRGPVTDSAILIRHDDIPRMLPGNDYRTKEQDSRRAVGFPVKV